MYRVSLLHASLPIWRSHCLKKLEVSGFTLKILQALQVHQFVVDANLNFLLKFLVKTT